MTTANPVTEKTSTPIHPATRLGHVHYTVADLERQVAFYRDILGFKEHWREGDSVGLGGGKADLLRLTQQADAQRPRRTTGLYHTAFLVPTRWELAQLLRSIAETRTPIQGMSNHGTHHAVYLPDAEGNGIELAWDLPQDQWPKTGAEMMSANRGLAPEDVFSALQDNFDPWAGLAAETQIGHVHLHVSQLEATDHFYREVLGFGSPFELPANMGAIFFAAGDYHHHIGTNVWNGVGAPPPPANATGLRYYSVILPDAAEQDRLLERVRAAGIAVEATGDGYLLRDPAQNGVLLTV